MLNRGNYLYLQLSSIDVEVITKDLLLFLLQKNNTLIQLILMILNHGIEVKLTKRLIFSFRTSLSNGVATHHRAEAKHIRWA